MSVELNVTCISLLDSNAALVCGEENGQWQIKRLNLHTGGELDSINLGYLPLGLVVVELGAKCSVSVSDG